VLDSLAPGFTLLCGGHDKGLPLDELARAAAGRARRAVVFGAARAALEGAFRAAGLATLAAPTLEQALELAFEASEPGAELLFSPACSSFDAFPNFRARAAAFRAALAGMERCSTPATPA
jgi:UDP-N-acetylmuramoylalanine--D-glutamate ligase